MNGMPVVAFAFAALVSSPLALGKEFINVQGSSSTCCIGEGASLNDLTSYWGQTFVALGKRIRHFEFYALDNFGEVYSGTFNFRILLMEGQPNVSGAKTVIFESDPVSVPYVANGGRFSAIVVDMSCAKLSVGGSYTWIVDAYSRRDGILDVGQIYTTTPGASGYPDGQLYGLFATGLGREADLNAAWWSGGGFDMAFHMAFFKHGDVPSQGGNVDGSSTIAVGGSCRL